MAVFVIMGMMRAVMPVMVVAMIMGMIGVAVIVMCVFVFVRMFMVFMAMIVRMRRLRFARRIGGLGQGIIFVERFVMAMFVPAAIGTCVGFKRLIDGLHGNVSQALQHVDQNRVVSKLQVIGSDFNQDVAITQVIRGPGQLLHGLCRYFEYGLQCSQHLDELAIFSHQQIAVAQYGSLV